MLRKKLNQCFVCFAVVRFGTEINRELTRRSFDDFFLGGARLDGDVVLSHINIISDVLRNGF